MNVNFASSLTAESDIGFLRHVALFKALPEGFVIATHAVRNIQVDPELSHEKILEEIGEHDVAYISTCRSFREIILGSKDKRYFLLLHVEPGRVKVEAVASDQHAPKIVEDIVHKLAKYPFENKEEDGVWMDVSYLTERGVIRHTQYIHCPKWEEIAVNYPGSVNGELDRLIKEEHPWDLGRLMIWCGPPGTGKTYAMRSLMMAWRDRFDFLFVADPDKLAANPSYYYEVASESTNRPVKGFRPSRRRAFDEDEDPVKEEEHKRTLFIFEDSADLIIEESRSRHWDKIGKLLNITDGLLGQGREDLFLVTFNEDIKEIDAAFLRPGRCISKIEFKKFRKSAGQEWLKHHGITEEIASKDDVTLAELYQKVNSSRKEEVRI